MSDAGRRTLCRAGFIAGCVLPSLIVAQWILFPRKLIEWEALARQSIGCDVRIGSVETPTPDEIIFRHVELMVPGSPSPITFDQAILRRSLDTESLELAPLEATREQLAGLAWVLRHRFASWGGSSPGMTVTCSHCSLTDSASDSASRRMFAIRDCRVRIDSSTESATAQVDWTADGEVPIPVRVQWNTDSIDRSERWSIDTQTAVVPCWLVQPFFSAARLPGEDAWFAGQLEYRSDHFTSVIEAHHLHLLNLDVAQLLRSAAQTPEPWQSPLTAAPGARFDATIGDARWSNGRIESMFAEIRCLGGGEIDARWLQAARRWLKVDVAGGAESMSRVPFDQLLAGFEIRGGELFVWGRRRDGLIASSPGQQPLIMASAASQRLSPRNLAGWLTDDDGLDQPVSTAALQILSHMPVVR